jgi:hypothetical protein
LRRGVTQAVVSRLGIDQPAFAPPARAVDAFQLARVAEQSDVPFAHASIVDAATASFRRLRCRSGIVLWPLAVLRETPETRDVVNPSAQRRSTVTQGRHELVELAPQYDVAFAHTPGIDAIAAF